MHARRGQHVDQSHAAPLRGRDRPVLPRVLARDRAHPQQLRSPVARTSKGGHHAVLLEIGRQLVIGQHQRSIYQSAHGQSPLLRCDVGKRAVIARVKPVHGGDLAVGQHRRGRLGIERRLPADDHVVALTPYRCTVCHCTLGHRLLLGWAAPNDGKTPVNQADTLTNTVGRRGGN
jgi:hypothetical protein